MMPSLSRLSETPLPLFDDEGSGWPVERVSLFTPAGDTVSGAGADFWASF